MLELSASLFRQLEKLLEATVSRKILSMWKKKETKLLVYQQHMYRIKSREWLQEARIYGMSCHVSRKNMLPRYIG